MYLPNEMRVPEEQLEKEFLALTETEGISDIEELNKILDRAVNFDTFARMFRDGLGARDALYLDGSISRLHAPELGRSDFGFSMGPIVGTVVPKE